MSFQVSRNIRRFADEDSETIGRDILRRKLHKFADKVDETIDNIIAHYARRISKQAGVLAETADGNVALKNTVAELQRRLKVAEDALEELYESMDYRMRFDCIDCTVSSKKCRDDCYVLEDRKRMDRAENALAAIREEGVAK